MKKCKQLTAAIRKAAKSIRSAIKQGAYEGADAVCAQVHSGAYYYKRKLQELEKCIPLLEPLPCREGMPYIFNLLWTQFKKEGFSCDKELIVEGLKGYDCNSYELDMLCTVINAAAIIETGLVCEKALNKESYSVKRLQAALGTLKKADLCDFTGIYPRLSDTERFLLEKEPCYEDMTEATKSLYRKALRRFAKKKGCSEKEALREAFVAAKEKGECMGNILDVDSRTSPVLYTSFAFATFLFTALAALWLCPLWAFLILIVPLGAFALGTADFLFSIKAKVKPCPAIAIDKLQDEKLTLTVITTLLEEDDKSFEALKRFCLTNYEKGMYFGILADLPAASSETVTEDAPLLKSANERIKLLNEQFGNRFCLFVRKRRKAKGGKWNGRERKRGAIEELVRYLHRGEGDFLVATGAEVRGVKFLLTLDADTNLPPSGAATLSGMMLHPLNRPSIKNGRIKSGYGILQPAVQTTLKSSRVTRFASLLAGVGGIDVYESAAFNRQQNVFGEGIFCGKGLIDIEAYARLLNGVLPEGRVLSHDMPEGNILRTRYVSDLCFTDNVPSNVLAYYSRLHRWIRGDTQNLSLLRGYAQGKRGSLRIVQNVLRHLCPVFSFAALCVAGFAKGEGRLWACLFALAGLLSPLLFTIISRPAALRFRSRRFFSSVKSGTVQSLSTVFFELCALCHKSLITADAVARSLVRLVTGKRLLSWVTAAQAEKNAEGNITTFVYRTFPSAVVGSIFFFVSNLWVTRLLGLLWFLFPVYAHFLSLPVEKQSSVSESLKKRLKLRAEPIWRFFEDNVGEKTAYLPPDNIQFSPVEAVAMRTSPTNIGLYLLSVVAAEDFGFISAEESERRIEKALDSIERMEKWKGHLYNWYALDSLSVLGGGYVSTVDSGNLCVCLVALSRFLYNSGRVDSARRAEALFEAADFTALYNGERNLFALGYDSGSGKISDICYDLYMSEARSTSYFALAFGQAPLKHWRALGRPVVGSKGHIGMASWSGTAFEYFMPQLFLPLYKDSFIYESLQFALSEQKGFSKGRLWGCSESAYFCFDSEMNYQYKAHGVQSLALCHYEGKEMVLSPYSVYLSMCIAPVGAMRTIAAYESSGLCGRYGLYEAVDCTGGGVIQSYMAHHMGMSLIALANACFEDAFVKRFMNHPRTEAFYELLQEKIPVGAPIHEANRRRSLPQRFIPRRSFTERLTEYEPSAPVFHISGSGGRTVVADSTGHVRFAMGDISVNETHFTPCSAARSLNVMFCHGNEVYSAAPYGIKGGKYSFEGAESYAAHICSSSEFSGRVKYYTDAAGCFVTETKSDGGKSFGIVFSFDVQLAPDKGFYAHPAFSRLFVTAGFDKENNALIYSKNSREGKERLYMAVGLSDKRLGFEFETNKESYEAFSLYRPEDALRQKYSNTTGVCVSPFCLIKTPPLSGGEVRLIIAVGHSKEECTERLKASRRSGGLPRGNALFGERENPLLKAVFYGKEQRSRGALVTNGDLWGRGLSGDFPIIAVLVREFYQSGISFYIRFFKKLAALNQRVELVFLICEEERYSSPVEAAVKRVIRQEKCDGFLSKRGGIFFADANDKGNTALFKSVADYYAECFDTPFEESNEKKPHLSLPAIIRRWQGEAALSGNKVCGGAYDEDGFTVDKNQRLSLPFSYILAGRGLCSVVTHGSLGYSFCGNAALKRIAAAQGDVYGGTDRGEAIYCFEDGKVYDLCASATTVSYGQGIAVYRGNIANSGYTLRVFACEKLPLKVMRLRLDKDTELDTALCVKPLMGSGAFPARSIQGVDIRFGSGCALGFANGRSAFFGGHVGFIACLGSGIRHYSESSLFTGEEGGAEDAFAIRCKGREIVFLLGAAPTARGAEEVLRAFVKFGVQAEEEKAKRFARSFLPPVSLSGISSADAAMLCRFAPYQLAACRFFARGAFYQSSGAYGFRDQLQDCMYLVYSMPKTVRTHLIRAAARQYTDGSVQHWWHPNRSEGKIHGVRSKCSDDFLWLPICTAEYIRITGDMDVLRTEIPYLKSAELGSEKERYEAAEVTDAKESLYIHCVRALEHGKNYGKHGLPLMGSCDWNDAFSDLGEEAESVFSGFLYVIALKRFAEVARRRGDEEYAARCTEEATALLKRCEECYTKGRFIRAYSGDGNALGVPGRAACEMDILCQAFAVFAGADAEKCRVAMENAYELLYDSENKLLRLFAPPFGVDTEYAGYINAYAKGVRENGGQYTHAAVWFAAALLKCGMKKEALELIEAINPLRRAEDAVLFSRYKGEPYAIAADIYTARGQAGRAGWTFYTGAAAWYCKVMLEGFLGVRFSDDYGTLWLSPAVEYDASFDFKGKVHISAKRGNALSLDGKAVSLPIKLDGGEHYICVPVE